MKRPQVQPDPLPASCDDQTPWQRLDTAFRTVLRVPKTELLKAEAKEKQLAKGCAEEARLTRLALSLFGAFR